MTGEWLAGAFALVGAALGAAVPSLLNRRYEKADKLQSELGELDRLLVAWEVPFSRAAATFTIGILDDFKTGAGASALADLNLHLAIEKLAEAKLLAARRMPSILPRIAEIELLDQRLARSYAEFVLRKTSASDIVLKLAELQEARSTKLNEIHVSIHRQVTPKGRLT